MRYITDKNLIIHAKLLARWINGNYLPPAKDPDHNHREWLESLIAPSYVQKHSPPGTSLDLISSRTDALYEALQKLKQDALEGEDSSLDKAL
jgi:hypothetical protein